MTTSSALPQPPADLWTQPEVTQAAGHQDFGRLLKAFRELQHPVIKQIDLANALGITQGHLSKMERGKTPVNDIPKMIKWAKVIGVPTTLLWFKVRNAPGAECSEPTNESETDIIDDVDRRNFLKLTGATTALTVTTPQAVSHAIGISDVERLRDWTQNFRRMDNRWGGGHSLSQATHYLSTEVVPMLRESRVSTKVHRALLVESAQLFQLTGWMYYDTNDQGRGHKAIRNAFQLADEAGNHALAAEMQAGMSHQTAFLKNSSIAQDFAISARHHANLSKLPGLQSEAAVMEAHALALQGDLRGTIRALSDAQNLFDKVRISDIPSWHSYYDQAYISAKFGHVLRDLGKPDDAEQYARASLNMSEGYERGRAFNLNLLAGILADRGELDEAIEHANLALKMTSSIRSSRMQGYLTDVAQRLNRYAQDDRVRSYYKQLRSRGVALQSN